MKADDGQRILRKLAKADRLDVSARLPGGSIMVWVDQFLDYLLAMERKNRRNARDRARRAQRRKGVRR